MFTLNCICVLHVSYSKECAEEAFTVEESASPAQAKTGWFLDFLLVTVHSIFSVMFPSERGPV